MAHACGTFCKKACWTLLQFPQNVANVNFHSDERLKARVLNADKFINDERTAHSNLSDLQISH